MDDHEVLAHFQQLLGGDEPSIARRSLDASMTLLAEALSPASAARIASALPRGLADAMGRAVVHGSSRDERDLARELSRRSGLDIGRAREAALAAYGLISRILDADALDVLLRELPQSIAALFAEHEAVEQPRIPRRARSSVQPLSTGEPGSSHPVASSEPRRARAHEHRLAVARGTSRQEIAGETLATGRPGERIEDPATRPRRARKS